RLPKILSSRMVNSGIARPANSSAHHIVGDTSKLAEPARRIMAKHKIDIDDPTNGVFYQTETTQTLTCPE
ncbi:AHH domain-containing protein, partial [Pseudomonas savastanoi]|uniref:AHH domain-containing protein n=1 Tax=Pseudomonas savastanoi TaxID=29438 RepID=UPI00217F5CBC